jgi:hypothetical protein
VLGACGVEGGVVLLEVAEVAAAVEAVLGGLEEGEELAERQAALAAVLLLEVQVAVDGLLQLQQALVHRLDRIRPLKVQLLFLLPLPAAAVSLSSLPSLPRLLPLPFLSFRRLSVALLLFLLVTQSPMWNPLLEAFPFLPFLAFGASGN